MANGKRQKLDNKQNGSNNNNNCKNNNNDNNKSNYYGKRGLQKRLIKEKQEKR